MSIEMLSAGFVDRGWSVGALCAYRYSQQGL